MDLVGTKNQEYIIIKQGKNAVLAKTVMPLIGDYYVAWDYKINNGKPEYFWGRYGSKEYAEDCFNKKEAGIYSGD